MRFEGRVFRAGRWWAAEVPALGIATQGRSRRDALAMVKDAVAVLAGEDSFHLEIFPATGEHFELGSPEQAALIAFFLKRQRQMSGLSLAEMSRRLGLKSRNAYARYEQGKTVPTIPKLNQLLKAINPRRDFVLRESA